MHEGLKLLFADFDTRKAWQEGLARRVVRLDDRREQAEIAQRRHEALGVAIELVQERRAPAAAGIAPAVRDADLRVAARKHRVESERAALSKSERLAARAIALDADRLGDPPLNQPQRQIHLKRAILGLRVAQPIHRALVGVGIDMRHAPRVAEQFDFAVVGVRGGER